MLDLTQTIIIAAGVLAVLYFVDLHL